MRAYAKIIYYLRAAAPAADPGEKKEVCAVFSHSSSWWLFHSHDTRGEIEREIYIVKFHQSEAIYFGCFFNVCLCCILT